MSTIIEGFLEGGTIAQRIIDSSVFILSNTHGDEVVSNGQFLVMLVGIIALLMVLASLRMFMESAKDIARGLRGLQTLLMKTLSLVIMYITYMTLRIISKWLGQQGIGEGPWRFVSVAQLLISFTWILAAMAAFGRFRVVNPTDLQWSVGTTAAKKPHIAT